MLKTPEHLTKEFSIAPQAGQGRAIPRVLLDYSGPNKKEFLMVMISAIMASALPEYGQKSTYCRDASQQDLAASSSVARETYTRWMSMIATPDDSWTVDRRLVQRDRSLNAHRRRGHRLQDRARSSREHLATLISRRRRFMKPNRYAPAFPGHLNPKRPDCWFPPLAEEAKGSEILQKFFGHLSGNGFKHIPQWVWSPALPVSWKARLVMTYYFMCGLGSKGKKEKLIGEVHPRQDTVARSLGISVKSVYNANRELERVGLIRVAHERIQRADGSYASGPQIIVYLPIRKLTSAEASEERERLKTMLAVARMTAGAAGAGWMTSRVKELHETVLKAWEGQEHSMRAFWNQVRRSAIGEGIHLKVINSLVPSPPE